MGVAPAWNTVGHMLWCSAVTNPDAYLEAFEVRVRRHALYQNLFGLVAGSHVEHLRWRRGVMKN